MAWNVEGARPVKFTDVKSMVSNVVAVIATSMCSCPQRWSLWWRQNEHDGLSDHQPDHCLLKRLFRRRSETSKLRNTGLCAGNSPVTGGFPAQRASNAENVSIWWHHHTWSFSLPVWESAPRYIEQPTSHRPVACVCVVYLKLASITYTYRQTSNIRRTFVGNMIVDYSNVVGASPVGVAPTTSWDLVRLILEILRYISQSNLEIVDHIIFIIIVLLLLLFVL